MVRGKGNHSSHLSEQDDIDSDFDDQPVSDSENSEDLMSDHDSVGDIYCSDGSGRNTGGRKASSSFSYRREAGKEADRYVAREKPVSSSERLDRSNETNETDKTSDRDGNQDDPMNSGSNKKKKKVNWFKLFGKKKKDKKKNNRELDLSEGDIEESHSQVDDDGLLSETDSRSFEVQIADDDSESHKQHSYPASVDGSRSLDSNSRATYIGDVSDGHATDAHSTDAHSMDANSTDVNSTDVHSMDTHSMDANSTDAHSMDAYSTDAHSTDAKSLDGSEDGSRRSNGSSRRRYKKRPQEVRRKMYEQSMPGVSEEGEFDDYEEDDILDEEMKRSGEIVQSYSFSGDEVQPDTGVYPGDDSSQNSPFPPSHDFSESTSDDYDQATPKRKTLKKVKSKASKSERSKSRSKSRSRSNRKAHVSALSSRNQSVSRTVNWAGQISSSMADPIEKPKGKLYEEIHGLKTLVSLMMTRMELYEKQSECLVEASLEHNREWKKSTIEKATERRRAKRDTTEESLSNIKDLLEEKSVQDKWIRQMELVERGYQERLRTTQKQLKVLRYEHVKTNQQIVDLKRKKKEKPLPVPDEISVSSSDHTFSNRSSIHPSDHRANRLSGPESGSKTVNLDDTNQDRTNIPLQRWAGDSNHGSSEPNAPVRQASPMSNNSDSNSTHLEDILDIGWNSATSRTSDTGSTHSFGEQRPVSYDGRQISPMLEDLIGSWHETTSRSPLTPKQVKKDKKKNKKDKKRKKNKKDKSVSNHMSIESN